MVSLTSHPVDCLFIQDLDHETLAHVDSENHRWTLEEQTKFLESVHDEVQQQEQIGTSCNKQIRCVTLR